MKYLKILTILFFSIILFSCVEVIENPNLPFEERIVVYGILEPNVPLELFINKTIPALTEYPSFSILRDANVQIESEGRIYVLYVKDSVYPNIVESFFTSDELIIQEGKTYNLTVNWRGKTVKSTTHIPPKPIATSVWNSDTSNSDLAFMQAFRTNISAKNVPNGIIMGILADKDTIKPFNDLFFIDNPYELMDYNLSQDSTIISFSRGFDDPFYNSYPYARLIAFDPAFLLYYRTLDGRNNNDGIFGGGGRNPIWNVTGDGLGLFLGVNPGYAVNINK